MAVLTGLSVLAGVGPVMFLINADIKARGLGAALVMAALAGFLASIAGVLAVLLLFQTGSLMAWEGSPTLCCRITCVSHECDCTSPAAVVVCHLGQRLLTL